MSHTAEIIFGSNPGQEPGFYRFDGFEGEISAYEEAEVVSALIKIEAAVHAGCYAVGFLSYEAAAALDQSLTVKMPSSFPLLWFGIFRERRLLSAQELPETANQVSYEMSDWQPAISREEYRQAIEKIRAYIGAGDCYQVNYTLQQHSSFRGDVQSFFLRPVPRTGNSLFCFFRPGPILYPFNVSGTFLSAG